ncbi:MAG: DUF4105 domain-containing protein [Gemmatimonadales bacterium]
MRSRKPLLHICLLLTAFALLPASGALSQARPPVRLPASPPDSLTVYLMTMGPGQRVWERFGHNAIWIHDPVAGTDETYNYGLFDFHQENFLLRFIQGRMWYWMQGFPAQSYVDSYRRANRSVWVQELEMPPRARRELQEFLKWNERPENRFYHYDYYRDNCSTRVRDALDHALGGRIRERTQNLPTGKTYRFHTLRLTANDPPVYTGLLLALGHPVDRPISAWEEMFLPLAMRDQLRKLTVVGDNGTEVPLVRSERTLFQSTDSPPPAAPPFWLPAYLVGGLAVGGAIFGLAGAARANRGARIGFLIVTSVWVMLAGLAGLVLGGLWAFTDHAAAYNNENVLQANLLVLPLLWLIPGSLAAASGRRRAALMLATVVAAMALAGLLLKLLPQFYQVNGQVIALALPAHTGVMAALWRLARS